MISTRSRRTRRTTPASLFLATVVAYVVVVSGNARGQEHEKISDLLVGVFSNSEPGVAVRDASACLARLRAVEPGTADLSVSRAATRLAADKADALKLADRAASDAARNPDAVTFGPVHAGEAGAAERLALLTRVARVSNRKIDQFLARALADNRRLRSAASELTADRPGKGVSGLFIAAGVESLLSGGADGLTDASQTWRDIAVPAVLRGSFDDDSLTRELTGGGWSDGFQPMRAASWEAPLKFVAPWLQQQLPSLQAFAPDSGELFRGERPLATHPLVLMLWLPKLKELVRSESSQDRRAALSLAQFIFENGVARPDLGAPPGAGEADYSIDPSFELPPAFQPAGARPNRLLLFLREDKQRLALKQSSTRQSMACCGATILSLAKEIGVAVDRDGRYSAPPGFEPWGELTEKTSVALVLGMEAVGFAPSGSRRPASDEPSTLASDFPISSRWLSSPPGNYLLPPAKSRLRNIWSRLATSTSRTRLTRQIQEIRQSRFRRAEDRAPGEDEVQQAPPASEEPAVERWTFESRTSGPLLEALLPEAIETLATTDLSAAALARSRLGRASPKGLHLAITRDSWPRLVNASIEANAPIPSSWGFWEYWDTVRGRLLIAKPDPSPVGLSFLAIGLPPWMREEAAGAPQRFDEAAVRPVAAAIALLGVPGEAGAKLRDRLRDLPGAMNTDLSIENKRMLAATYLELVVTMLAARDESERSASLASLSLEDVEAIADRAVLAAESTNAWEFRAGLNGLTLLSRWAELTGDPDAARLARETIAKSKKSVAAVRSALGGILNDDGVAGPTSALPLAIAAYDLLVWDRIASSGIEPLTAPERRNRVPAWLKDPPLPGVGSDDPRKVIAALSTRLAAAGSNRLNRFTSGGGRAGQELVTALLQIRNREFQRSRLLTPQPALPDDRAWVGLLQLLGAVWESHAIEGLLNEGPVANERTAGWRSVGWWSARANARVAVNQRASTVPLSLISWSETGRFEEQRRDRLAKNAALEAAIPPVEFLSEPPEGTIDSLSKDRGEPVDVDGLTAHALPNMAFQESVKRLAGAATALQKLEADYRHELEARDATDRHGEILALLKAPLALNTADYEEQIAAAIAQVRAAEAEVDAANFDSVSAQMESVAKDLLAQSATLEVDRAKALKEVAVLEQRASELRAAAAMLNVDTAQNDVELREIARKKAEKLKEIAGIELAKARRARDVVKDEVQMLRQILDPRRGAIRVLADQIEKTLDKQLTDEINTAVSEVDRWRAIERRSALISGIGRFVGAVVGFITGGPAGATLLSQAGGAIGDLTNDIIDASEGHVPVEQIFVRLAQNAAGIAKGAGLDLSKELDGLLGAEGLRSDPAYSELLGKLEPAIRSLPRMLDDDSVRRAFSELGVALRGQGFSGIPELGPIANQALALIGTWSDPDERALANPDAFRSAVRNSVAALPPAVQASLGLSVGLDGGADKKEIGNRLANLALAKLVGEANRIRQQTLQDFVARNLGKSWDSPPVLRDLGTLLQRLYPGDPTAQGQVRESIKRSLPNQKTYQAKIQQLLKPWREGLDQRLANMQRVLDGADYSGARSQSELATKRLEVLTQAADVFDRQVVPYLRRETTPDPAGDLLTRLENEVQRLAGAEDDVKIVDLKQKLEDLNLNDAIAGLAQAETLLKIAQELSGAAALESDAASVRVRIADIGEKQAGLQGEAAAALKRSAGARESAAKARIRAALARLDESKSRLAAAQKRGAEAARIREAVSRPPLLGRAAESRAGSLAAIMREHADELARGLAASRDLQRLYRAIQTAPPVAADVLMDEKKDATGTWGDSLKKQAAWIEDNEGKLSTPVLREKQPLSKEQITAMRSPLGLKLVHTFRVPPEGKLRPDGSALLPDGSVWKRLEPGNRGETSRIVAILLDGKLSNGSDISEVGPGFYADSAMHLGDLRLSNGDVAKLGTRRMSADRFLPVTSHESENYVETLNHRARLNASLGAPRSLLTEGVPMSGTLVVRIGSQMDIESLTITVIYSFTSAN